MIKFSKGLVFTAVLVGLLFAPALPAQAQTDEVTIESLMALIDDLKAQIAEIEAQQSDVQAARRALRLDLRRFLQEGATGDDVELLQEYLALDSEIYPQGLVTGYYGPLTAAAVRKFQRRHGIDQVGVVGPITRGRLNELFEGGWGPNEIPPGLLTAPGIQKKGGFCAVPGIAKRLEECEGFEPGDNGEEEDAQCSDGEDNDEDELVDIDDPGCHTDGDAGNESSYDADDDDEADEAEEEEETTLTVIKVMVNNDGGIAEVDDFDLFVGDEEVDSGEENDFEPGVYVVTEDGPGGYEATFSGDCDVETGEVTLEEGDDKTCTITNDDVEVL